jgi:ABC-type transporter MlaC component
MTGLTLAQLKEQVDRVNSTVTSSMSDIQAQHALTSSNHEELSTSVKDIQKEVLNVQTTGRQQLDMLQK